LLWKHMMHTRTHTNTHTHTHTNVGAGLTTTIKPRYARALDTIAKEAAAATTAVKQEAAGVAASIELHTCAACNVSFFDDDVGCKVGTADRCGACAPSTACPDCGDSSVSMRSKVSPRHIVVVAV
jgi:hypothetical protein